jgi:hypothetical protein
MAQREIRKPTVVGSNPTFGSSARRRLPQLQALLQAPSGTWVVLLDSLVWLTLIFDMVVKPF